MPDWDRTITIVVDRNGETLALPVLVTERPYNYDPAHPHPTVTPVPSSLDSSTFYL
ncbi:MAG: hypothetical protein ACR2GA_00415 [Chloroflexota bacterium]